MRGKHLRIAVVGCGTAGPAAGILLRRLGHEVVLFERAPECLAVGAGFLLQPSGIAVLSELGIRDQILSHAARIERMHVVNPKARTLVDLRYAELGPGQFGAGLHRPVLLHYLIQQMLVAGVEIRWGWEIDAAEKSERGWSLSCPDGRSSDGFDLLVIADGARSKLRELVSGTASNRGYPWGAHWFIGQNDGVFPENELFQVVQGTRRLCGFLATGRDLAAGAPLVSVFWSIKIAEDAALRARPLSAWKEDILGLCPRAEGLLGQINDWSQILTARYGDVRMDRWYGDSVVVLGDAGHAMSPQLGQGVNLALADASSLARCVARYPLSQALLRYQRERRLALGYYQLATRWLTPWFQSDYEWLTPLRGGFFRFAQAIPTARRLMTLSMAGMVGARSQPSVD